MTPYKPVYTIYKLYGNSLVLYIIDRLWKAGLLSKNGRKYPAVYKGKFSAFKIAYELKMFPLPYENLKELFDWKGHEGTFVASRLLMLHHLQPISRQNSSPDGTYKVFEECLLDLSNTMNTAM